MNQLPEGWERSVAAAKASAAKIEVQHFEQGQVDLSKPEVRKALVEQTEQKTKPIPGLVGEEICKEEKWLAVGEMNWRSEENAFQHLATLHQPWPEQARALAEQRADLRNHLRGGGWFDPKPSNAA